MPLGRTGHRAQRCPPRCAPALPPACPPPRRLARCPQAALVVADRNQSLQITGNGDVLEPHDGIIAIGSGRCGAGRRRISRGDRERWRAPGPRQRRALCHLG